MDDRDQRRADAYTRGQTFCRDNEADFAPTSDFHTHYATLGAALKKMSGAGADRVGGGNASKTAIVDAIRIDCRNIRRTAVSIGQDEPGFADDFPPAEHSDSGVITIADAYLKKFEPATDAAKAALAARFVAKDLPLSFVTDLRADRDAYDDAGGAQESKRRGNVEDTRAIEIELGNAGKQIRYLNAIMHNKYSRNAEKLRGWKSAIHIERAPKRKKDDNDKGNAGTSGGKPS